MFSAVVVNRVNALLLVVISGARENKLAKHLCANLGTAGKSQAASGKGEPKTHGHHSKLGQPYNSTNSSIIEDDAHFKRPRMETKTISLPRLNKKKKNDMQK